MVVVGALARYVGMVPGGQVQALEEVQLGEQVQGTEDRRPRDPQTTCPGIVQQARGREEAFPRCDELCDSAARLGEYVSGPIQGEYEGPFVHECLPD
jgi:hypothetical protein